MAGFTARSAAALMVFLAASLGVVSLDSGAASAAGITVYSRVANGDVPPIRVLSGPATSLVVPQDDIADPLNDELYVADFHASAILVFSRSASGDVAPIRTIAGAATLLSGPVGLYVDTVNNEIGVVSGSTAILIFSRMASGNVPPLRTISGAATGLSLAKGLTVDTVNDEIVVASTGNDSIRAFGRTASGDVVPLRVLSGADTGLAGGGGQVPRVDTTNNELIVTNAFTNSVLVFTRTASGNVVPLRTIAGAATGLNVPVGVYVDEDVNLVFGNNEIGVANLSGNSILVFSRTVDGNVAPLRTISGPLTGLNQPVQLALDRLNDEIFVVNLADPVVVPPTVVAAPTLSEWAQIVMVALLVVGGLLALRRRVPVLR